MSQENTTTYLPDWQAYELEAAGIDFPELYLGDEKRTRSGHYDESTILHKYYAQEADHEAI